MSEVMGAVSPQRQAYDDWVTRVLQFRFPAPEAEPTEPPAPPPGFDPGAPDPHRLPAAGAELKGMALWQSERSKAIAALDGLAAAFRATDHPDRDGGVLLLLAVRANLTEVPATAQQLDELQRYLDTDDVVEAAELPNPFGVHVALREPLSRAIASLRADLAA